jgi:hypothetical protein
MTKPKKPAEETETTEEVSPKDGDSKPTQDNQILEALMLRDVLLYMERKSGIPTDTDNYYEFSAKGNACKIPVRVESIGVQAVPNSHYVSFGSPWAVGGTTTITYDPITGDQDAEDNYVNLGPLDYSFSPSNINWFYTVIGQMWHVLENNIRSHKNIDDDTMKLFAKALGAYLDMAYAAMIFTSYYANHLDGYMNRALSNMYADDGQSVSLFYTRDELRTRLIQNIMENFFPLPMFDFWLYRYSSCLPRQVNWNKFMLFIPFDDVRYHHSLLRFFDGYDENGDNWVHPETFLRAEGVWDVFYNNFLPLLWGLGHQQERFRGIQFEDYLKSIGWRPLDYSAVRLQYIQKGFHLHPFDETLGVGQDKLLQNLDDDDLTLLDFFYGHGYQSNQHWNEPGRTFFLYPDAFRVTNREMPIASPWLDLILLSNYASQWNYTAGNKAAVGHGKARTLRGSLNYAGDTFSDLSYEVYYWLFQDTVNRTHELETIKPDPDIEFDIADAGNLLAQDQAFCVPFRMPPARWMIPNSSSGTRRKLDINWSIFFQLQLDDVEIFKQQRALPRTAGAQS